MNVKQFIEIFFFAEFIFYLQCIVFANILQSMDWIKILNDLRESGMTQKQIAAQCGDCAQSTLSEIANGKNKLQTYELGAALVALHAKVMRRKKRKS